MTGIVLYHCERMGANISKAQCDRNRNGVPNSGPKAGRPACLSCAGCPGLGADAVELAPIVHDPEPIIEQKVVQVVVPFEVREEETVAHKICDQPGCGTKVHSRGKCWKHVKSVLGINPSNGKPLDNMGSLEGKPKPKPKKASPPPVAAAPVTKSEKSPAMLPLSDRLIAEIESELSSVMARLTPARQLVTAGRLVEFIQSIEVQP